LLSQDALTLRTSDRSVASPGSAAPAAFELSASTSPSTIRGMS
jgi:hypothetical protein